MRKESKEEYHRAGRVGRRVGRDRWGRDEGQVKVGRDELLLLLL